MKDKVVLITGASGGIGRATALAFAAEGARLALHAHQNPRAVEELKKQLAAPSITVAADVTDETQVARMFGEVVAHFGVINVLVANAGIWTPEPAPVHKMMLKRWNETIAADQTSVFLCAREFFRVLKEKRPESASLIIIGSTAAIFGEEGHSDYAAAKAAVTYGLTRSLKNEIVRLVPSGRVNAVAPGWTLTAMAEGALLDRDTVRRALQTRPIKRIARVEDVAAAIVFLASDRLAGQISGELITIAGGMEGRVLHDPETIDPGYA